MQYPRVVRRGPRSSALWVVVACLVATSAPVRAEAAPEKGVFPRVRILSGLRRIALPAGRWSLEQHSFGLGVELEPFDGLVLESLAEVSSIDLSARRLSVDPVEVEAKLSLDRSWGFAHAA